MTAVLEEARTLGFLGPGPVAPQIDHALGFAAAWSSISLQDPVEVADLGAGGGLPALPMALAWPGARWLLVETIGRRAAFLERAVLALGLEARVTVAQERAEAVGRLPAHRGAYDLVTSRGVGPPSVAAELGAPLLRAGGHLIVSEPPGGHPDRWPAEGLAQLGLGSASIVTTGDGSYAAIRQAMPCPDRYPRKAGIPAKRPLF